MNYPEIIQSALDYIEQNLKTQITAEELAHMANYSTYHYYRLFSSVMGSSIASYILKRRLDHALAEIANGRVAIDVVLEYGFETYSGFYKSFVKMYGCSPKKYLSIYQEHKPTKPEVVNMYTEKELRKILDNWDIEDGLPIDNLNGSDGSNVYRRVWTLGNNYILKCCKLEKLMKNLKISKALHHQGFASSLPVLTKTGSEYVEYKELFVLTRGLKGNPLSKSDRFGHNRMKFAEQYGKSIAKLHTTLKNIQKDIFLDEINLYKNVIEWALPSFKRQNIQWGMGLDDDFFYDFIDNFGILYDKLPKQLIHRDPNPGNILFDNGVVTGFIDFDLSEVNIRLWDVCYCATGILSEASDEAYEKWLEILGGILKGYDLEAGLTSEEKQAIFYVICSIQMICIAYFEGHDIYKELAKTNRRMLQFIIQNKEVIESISK
jgi:AraC-like DNA-binding protein